jgi:hypothetical protein
MWSDNLRDHLKRWRDHAQEARTDADALTDPWARERMIDIAAGFERLSQEAERLLGHKTGTIAAFRPAARGNIAATPRLGGIVRPQFS